MGIIHPCRQGYSERCAQAIYLMLDQGEQTSEWIEGDQAREDVDREASGEDPDDVPGHYSFVPPEIAAEEPEDKQDGHAQHAAEDQVGRHPDRHTERGIDFTRSYEHGGGHLQVGHFHQAEMVKRKIGGGLEHRGNHPGHSPDEHAVPLTHRHAPNHRKLILPQ